MNALLIPYPEIDPVLIELGPFAIRWYALAYIAGLVIGWQIMRRVCEQPPKLLSPVKIDDFLLWAALGVILGGRLGYVLFYKPLFYAAHPLAILTLWEGGMSFHGGLLGVVAAILLFAWRNKVDPLMLADLVAIVTPIGLFFGRLANWRLAVCRGLRRLALARRPPPARPDHRRVLLRLWRGAHRRRAVPRTRRASRLPVGSPHHGHAAVDPAARLRRLADRPRAAPTAAAVTSEIS